MRYERQVDIQLHRAIKALHHKRAEERMRKWQNEPIFTLSPRSSSFYWNRRFERKERTKSDRSVRVPLFSVTGNRTQPEVPSLCAAVTYIDIAETGEQKNRRRLSSKTCLALKCIGLMRACFSLLYNGSVTL
jgi:hypothetical protein